MGYERAIRCLLLRIRRAKKPIENSKASVVNACQIDDLNTFFGVSPAARDLPETAFFTPLIDTPADQAMKNVLERSVRGLAPEQRIDWARLLVSFAVRTPDALRDMGPKEAAKAIDQVEEMAKGPPDAERKVSAIMRQNMPVFQRNFPLAAAVEISLDPSKATAINGMQWWTR